MPGTRETTASDYRALAELRHRIRCFLNFSESVARSMGIEPQQHQLILAVKGLPQDMRPTVVNLAARLQVRHHTAVGLIDRLVKRGMLERHKGQSDKREVLVTIRPKGEAILKQLSRAHRDELQSQGPALLRALEVITKPRRERRTGATV